MPQLLAAHTLERDACIAFMAASNGDVGQHCLHFADTISGIEADITARDIQFDHRWLARCDAGEIRALCGVDSDGNGRGWLYGPWSKQTDDLAARGAVLDAVLQQSSALTIAAYADVRATSVIAQLCAYGFRDEGVSHVMVAVKALPLCPRYAVTAWRDDDTATLRACHTAAFPDSWVTPERLFGEEAQSLLVARDADGTPLGLLWLSHNADLSEADVEVVSVVAASRGQGVGRALLLAALSRAFDTLACRAVNLVVRDANSHALALYQSVGFQLLYSGVCLSRPAVLVS